MLATAIFYYNWYNFVVINNQTGHLLGRANLIMALSIYAVLYILVARWLHAFKIGVERKGSVLAGQVLTLLVVAFLEVLISCAITGQYQFFFRFMEIYFFMFLLQSLVNGLLSIVMINVYRKSFPALKIIEIYGQKRNDLNEKINAVPFKYHIEKSISAEQEEKRIRDLILPFDAVLINDLSAYKKNRILKMCFDLDKRVYFVPKISDIIVRSSEELNLLDTPIFLSRNTGIPFVQGIIKRIFDVLLSTLALVVLSPIFVIIAVAIKVEDGGPVFYKQERVTLNGQCFWILKFRSMIVDAEKDGKSQPAGEEDRRITKVGKFIRTCRMDELPQVFNIIRGSMSIVGPRPERCEHVEQYTQEICEFPFRSKIKGGLTGYAQVYGKYNTTALDKLKLDLIYITNFSLLLDLQIMFETVKILVQKESTEEFSEEQREAVRDGVEEGTGEIESGNKVEETVIK